MVGISAKEKDALFLKCVILKLRYSINLINDSFLNHSSFIGQLFLNTFQL